MRFKRGEPAMLALYLVGLIGVVIFVGANVNSNELRVGILAAMASFIGTAIGIVGSFYLEEARIKRVEQTRLIARENDMRWENLIEFEDQLGRISYDTATVSALVRSDPKKVESIEEHNNLRFESLNRILFLAQRLSLPQLVNEVHNLTVLSDELVWAQPDTEDSIGTAFDQTLERALEITAIERSKLAV